MFDKILIRVLSLLTMLFLGLYGYFQNVWMLVVAIILAVLTLLARYIFKR